MKLRISDSLSLPPDFITQTAAILAIRGAGKSNLAAVIAEQMFAAKLPFVVVDPTGTWTGLRSAGSGPGLPVVIFGGRDADVPLERGAGAMIADLIAEERLSSVIDVSEFSEGDKVHFLTDFGRRLYQKNRDPLMLILEEADDYVPQRPGPRQAECLRVFQDIVRRGRARGLGIIMVTQRSAVISKDVLTQIETLFVLRTTSPQDRKAIQAWVDYHGQSRELVDSLPTLKPGEAWVWSPHYLGTVKRTQVDRRTTLDTAATPKDARRARAPSTKADVDLVAVSARMAATIERAKADDPKELRAKIAALERELRAVKAAPAGATQEQLEAARAEGAQAAGEAADRRTAEIVERLKRRDGRIEKRLDEAREAVQNLQSAIDCAAGELVEIDLVAEGIARQVATWPATSRPTVAKPAFATPGPRAIREVAKPAEGLTGSEQKILDGAAELKALGLSPASRGQLGFMCGYTNVRSGGFSEPLGHLIQLGLMYAAGPGMVGLSPEGCRVARHHEAPTTSGELQERILAALDGPEAKILRALIILYPNDSTRDELGASLNYTNTRSGGFSEPLGKLLRLGLATSPARGRVRASDMLFLEGA